MDRPDQNLPERNVSSIEDPFLHTVLGIGGAIYTASAIYTTVELTLQGGYLFAAGTALCAVWGGRQTGNHNVWIREYYNKRKM